MPSTITLSLVDGVRIVVPDSLDLLTPYVLLEQQDWFEDEVPFSLPNQSGPGSRLGPQSRSGETKPPDSSSSCLDQYIVAW